MKICTTREKRPPGPRPPPPGAWSLALLCAWPGLGLPAATALAADDAGPALVLATSLASDRDRASLRGGTEDQPAADTVAIALNAADQAAQAQVSQADLPRLPPLPGATPSGPWRGAGALDREAATLPQAGVAATTAWEEAQAAERAAPGSVAPLQLATLQQQALAQQLRWAVAERDQRTGLARFTALDRLLADLDAALVQQQAAAAQASPDDARAWQDLLVALSSDRLLALLERGRPDEVIALYEGLRASGATLKPYALVAVADALAQQRRSAEAVPLYEAALLREGEPPGLPVENYFGLIYAYLDTGRFEEAEALLARLEAETPALLRLAPAAGQPNPEYSGVKGMRGFLLLYTGRLKEAQQHFDALTQEAPFNASYAEGAAEAELLLGHPRAALAQLEALSANHPYDRNIRAEYAQTLLTLNEFAAARRIGESLASDYPDSTFVRKFEREQRAVTGAYLEMETAAGTGGGQAVADRSWSLDARLSSPLIGDEWRVFYDQSLGWGDTGDQEGRWARGGLGLGWQRGGWLAEAKVQQANRGPYRSSAAGLLSYRASDHWLLSASVDGNSRDVPWKARVADIGARDASASAAYLVDEGRRFDLSWQRLMFSDTNRRNAASLSWRERWISGPRLQLESVLGAYTSRNRLQDTPYFSPSRDASVQASLRGQWLSWKNDDRQFFQALEAGAGRYHQNGFGSGTVWVLRYEHQWNLGPRLQVRYGLSLSRHPYDGVSEQQRGVFLSLVVPLS